MSMTFTKLFSSITESTIWVEDDRTRLVWITMLAMCDRKGRVWASIPGLANRARVPVEDAERAVDKFLQPDKYSRTPDFDGRRIEGIDGGWRLLNHEKYRSIRDEEAIKESKRNYINTRREVERVENVEECRTPSNAVDASRHNAESDPEAEAKDISPSATSKKSKLRDDARTILLHLNATAGTSFRMADSHLTSIVQRLSEPDVTVDGCKEMIESQFQKWKGTEWVQYMRPSTLFKLSKFSGYYDSRHIAKPNSPGIVNGRAVAYDAPRTL